MSLKTMPERMTEALTDSVTTSEQIKYFENTLRASLTRAEERAAYSLLLFLIFSSLWFIVWSARATKISFLGVEIVDTHVPLLVLPVLSGFAFYQYQCLQGFVDICDAVLRIYYEKTLEPFSNRGIVELLVPPSFLNVENTYANMEETGSFYEKVTNIWGMSVFLLLFLGPAAVLIWMAYAVITAPNIAMLWSILSLLLITLLLCRAALVFIQGMRFVAR